MDTPGPSQPIPALPLDYQGTSQVPLRARRIIWALAGILAWSAINSLAMIASFLAMLIVASLRIDPLMIGGIATAAQYLTIVVAAAVLLVIFSSESELSSGAVIFLGISALILALAAAVIQVLGQSFIVRMVNPSGFGRISIIRSMAYMIWTPLMPVVAMVLMLWLHNRPHQQR
jgi:hypothetical protein